jgi:hypothetical protein
LKAEGLLRSRWGSKTILEATSIDRQLRFRGVVAQLVSLASFYHEPHCRELVAKLSDELWHQRFVSRLWLYDTAEAEQPAFCERIIAEKPDSIVWLMPSPRMTTLGQRLMNCGIRVIRATAAADIIEQLLR